MRTSGKNVVGMGRSVVAVFVSFLDRVIHPRRTLQLRRADRLAQVRLELRREFSRELESLGMEVGQLQQSQEQLREGMRIVARQVVDLGTAVVAVGGHLARAESDEGGERLSVSGQAQRQRVDELLEDVFG